MEKSIEREFHAVADLFPLLEGALLDELAADIRKNGLREAILVDAEGRILDGRNRYRACLKAGVKPRFVEWGGKGSLAELALSLNLHRRHLDESQRAMVAARLANYMKTKALARKGRRTDLGAILPPGDSGKSRDKAAAHVNVSPRLVTTAGKILREGSDELIAAVESGALPVTTASTLTELSKEEQTEVVKSGPKGVAARVRQIRKQQEADRPARRFGMIEPKGSIVLLWVDASGKDEVVSALRSSGFEFSMLPSSSGSFGNKQ